MVPNMSKYNNILNIKVKGERNIKTCPEIRGRYNKTCGLDIAEPQNKVLLYIYIILQW